MKKVVTYELDEEDKRLLRNLDNLPTRPDCDAKCGSWEIRRGCCGCPEMLEWERAWKVYEERGLADLARQILNNKLARVKVERMKQNITSMEQDIKKMEEFEKSIGL